jgi:hypothetical protein
VVIAASLRVAISRRSKILGHKRAATTERYAHLFDAPVIAAVGDLGRAVGAARLRLAS